MRLDVKSRAPMAFTPALKPLGFRRKGLGERVRLRVVMGRPKL